MVALLVGLLATPSIQAPVTDPTGYLQTHDVQALDAALRTLRDQTGVQMAVVVVASANGPIEDFAQAVFDDWEGGSAERDDGVLLVFAIKDRRSRLHLGYGIEPFIPDGIAKRILDDQRPYLRAERYGQAALSVVDKVAERVATLEPGDPIERPLGFSLFAVLLVALCGLFAGGYWRWSRRRGGGPALTYTVWLGLPVLVAMIFHAGPWMFLGYAIAWYLMALAGIAAQEAAVKSPGRAVVWAFVAVPMTAFVSEGGLRNATLLDGGDVVYITVLLGFGLFASYLFTFMPQGGGSGGGWTGGSSSGGWSSSGGGWSGGGGSSGGGGASSSW